MRSFAEDDAHVLIACDQTTQFVPASLLFGGVLKGDGRLAGHLVQGRPRASTFLPEVRFERRSHALPDLE
jgi:hypothetical protein